MLAVTAIALIVMIALAIPIGAALGLLGVGLGLVFSPVALDRALGEIFWRSSNDFLIVAVPMFVLLGELVLRAGIAKRMYDALGHWLSWLPGGLMHTNVGSCAMFAATSGSSVATAATLGTVAMPECERHGYNRRLFLGTLASGGTLGILIPPSINLIVYGLLTNTSVPKLYLAGFLPGILLALLFMGTVLVACLVRPDFGGEPVRSSWRARFHSLVDLLPPLFLFLLVIGSIYAGLATPTEAAALGVIGALVLSVWAGTLVGRHAEGRVAIDHAHHRRHHADHPGGGVSEFRSGRDRPDPRTDAVHRRSSSLLATIRSGSASC